MIYVNSGAAEQIVSAIIDNATPVQSLFETFIAKVNSFSLTFGPGKAGMKIGEDEKGKVLAALKPAQKVISEVSAKVEAMTPAETEVMWKQVSTSIMDAISVLAAGASFPKTERMESATLGWHPDTISKPSMKKTILWSAIDEKLATTERGPVFLISAAGGGKSTLLERMMSKEDTVLIRWGEPPESAYDGSSHAVRVTEVTEMLVLSALLVFLDIDCAVDSVRLWYTSIEGAAVTKGMSKDIPHALTAISAFFAFIGPARLIMTLNPSYAVPGERSADDLMSILFEVLAGSTTGVVLLESGTVTRISARTTSGRYIMGQANGSNLNTGIVEDQTPGREMRGAFEQSTRMVATEKQRSRSMIPNVSGGLTEFDDERVIDISSVSPKTQFED